LATESQQLSSPSRARSFDSVRDCFARPPERGGIGAAEVPGFYDSVRSRLGALRIGASEKEELEVLGPLAEGLGPQRSVDSCCAIARCAGSGRAPHAEGLGPCRSDRFSGMAVRARGG